MSVEDASGDAAGIPMASHSVTLLIQQLKSDSSDAPGRIWSRFFERLLPIAKSRLRGLRDHSVDEEDVLVSVFDLFFRAAREGRFVKLEDRDDLWQILLLLTDRKVSEQYRRSHAQKRGAAQMELAGDTLDGLRGDSPPPGALRRV